MSGDLQEEFNNMYKEDEQKKGWNEIYEEEEEKREQKKIVN